MTMKAPRGLSAWARTTWREFHEAYAFSRSEDVLFERSLKLFDLADTFLREAQTAGVMQDGRLHPLVGASRDATQNALRCWRACGFRDDPRARRPGRPSGDNWSAKRQALAELRRAGA